MEGLTVAAYVIVFFIYSYLGATFEHLSYRFSDSHKILANPIITGFPIYGLAALMFHWLAKVLNITSVSGIFALTATTGTLVEYIIGYYVGAGKYSGKSYNVNTPVESWDYRGESYNMDGVISLRHFITWGLLGTMSVRLTPWLLKASAAAIGEFSNTQYEI